MNDRANQSHSHKEKHQAPYCVTELECSIGWCSKYISNLGYSHFECAHCSVGSQGEYVFFKLFLNLKCTSLLTIVKSQLWIFVKYSLAIPTFPC